MSEETPKIVNPVSYDSTGTVYLTPSLANRMTSADHVIVTTVDPDTPNVKWSEVDKDSLQRPYSNKRVPSSKIVGDIADVANSTSMKLPYLSNCISSISNDVTILQQNVQEIIDSDQIINIRNSLTILSNNLSGLFGQHVTRFIGVSETDPLCGIVTIDGNRYVVSTDFDTSNNGNVIYYKKTIANHVQCGGHSDQHEPVSAITTMYAYIYANGVWNDSGHITFTNDGQFHRFGYSFYENLSTLIHDDMVCDYANIKITKISGLQQALNKNTDDHSYLSGRIDALNNNLSNYQLKTSAETSARNLNDGINATNVRIDELSGKLSIYLPRSVRVQTLNHPNDTTIPSTSAVNQALTAINYNILTTRTDLAEKIELSSNDLLSKLQLSVHNILNILSATLRPEVNSVNKRNQTIHNYTW